MQPNRRKYFRIKMDDPLCGVMTVIQINDAVVKTGASYVCIADIGPGGLRFITSLSMPPSPTILLKIHITIVGEIFELEGYIVRSLRTRDNTYEYGMQFVFENENLRAKLVSSLNILNSRLIKGIKVES